MRGLGECASTSKSMITAVQIRLTGSHILILEPVAMLPYATLQEIQGFDVMKDLEPASVGSDEVTGPCEVWGRACHLSAFQAAPRRQVLANSPTRLIGEPGDDDPAGPFRQFHGRSFGLIRNIETKKYCKISKTTRKKISPETTKGFIPEYKRIYETSLFLYSEEKSTEVSGSKKFRRKKSLQVQLHSERTEIASSSMKPSKEKKTRKESTLYKLPCHKTSSPLRPTPSLIRKKEMTSNLYLTLYEQMPEEILKYQELNALQKACLIFSKVREGKVYVNDLTTVLHPLKVSMSHSEMLQVLKTVDIDEFQNALRNFSKVKSGRVPVDEVAAFLDSMEIQVDPEMLRDVMSHSYVDSNHTVDIGDIIFVLDELQRQYEDVSIMDEATSSKRPSYAPGYHPQHKKKVSSYSRLIEPFPSKKPSVAPLQHHSRDSEKHEEPELKRSKPSLQARRSSSRTDSDYVGIQEATVHDLESESPTLKSTSSLNKLPSKSDTSGGSKLQKLTVRKQPSTPKLVSSKEKAAVSALENVHDTINKLQGSYISPEELQSALPSVGVTISEKDFQKVVPEATETESGMVNLDDFIVAVSKEHNFSEYDALKDAIKTINKIQDENVAYEDLETCLQSLGVYLPKSELKKIKELAKLDETKNVNFKEFIDTMMKNTESFSKNLLLPETIELLNNLSKDQMDISSLWDRLSSQNSHLKKDEFLDAVNLTTVDGDKVQLEEFSRVVKDMHDALRLKELQNIASALNSLGGEKIARKQLEDFLQNLGITLFKDEVEKILQSDIVSEDNMVNVKDCIEALRDTSKFSNFTDLRKEALSLNMKLPTVSEIKEAADILSHVDGKITVSDLKHALKYLGVSLSEEDVSEALKHCDTTDNTEVNLKDFLMEIKNTPSFKDSVVTQLLVTTPQVLKDDLLDVSDFKKLLLNDDLRSAEAMLSEVLKAIPEREEGKVPIEDFVAKFLDTLTILNSEACPSS
ncbi:EF-hand calcium-binding domain-containing protein 13 [Acomys russatus]|uniref:EF-hand calcium-binding domain-containing protein 13 n=1 Tax=Acomys russatus TaxID=60746 RepID=UPI0021E2B1A6|nr:EF-hand calcium-binding domain-containing protein 13 [Acomys russatus]